ncbi:MAG: hypothetical protein AAGJ18_00920 [Bacteroidota bacterium]
MKDYIDDILKGTAMEEVQIIKTTSKPQPTPVPDTTEKVKSKQAPSKRTAKTTATPSSIVSKKAGTIKFVPNPNIGSRRGPDFASIRVPKEFTEALLVLFDNGKLTLIMDEVICDYLNRNRTALAQKYQAKNPFTTKAD